MWKFALHLFLCFITGGLWLIPLSIYYLIVLFGGSIQFLDNWLPKKFTANGVTKSFFFNPISDYIDFQFEVRPYNFDSNTNSYRSVLIKVNSKPRDEYNLFSEVVAKVRVTVDLVAAGSNAVVQNSFEMTIYPDDNGMCEYQEIQTLSVRARSVKDFYPSIVYSNGRVTIPPKAKEDNDAVKPIKKKKKVSKKGAVVPIEDAVVPLDDIVVPIEKPSKEEKEEVKETKKDKKNKEDKKDENKSLKKSKIDGKELYRFKDWDEVKKILDDKSENINFDANDSVPLGFTNALRQALVYLDCGGYSYTRLIEQLEYEGYTHEQAVYAVNNCGADWYEQAYRCAKDYVEGQPFSRKRLLEQLQYEGFTSEQALHGVDRVGL